MNPKTKQTMKGKKTSSKHFRLNHTVNMEYVFPTSSEIQKKYVPLICVRISNQRQH